MGNHAYMKRTGNPAVAIALVVTLSAVLGSCGDSGDDAVGDKVYIGILREAMYADGYFWMKVHAAEDLIFNRRPEGVEEYFSAFTPGDDSEVVGVSRVLARIHRGDPAEYERHVRRVVDVFLDEGSDNRVGAAETLGKLGYAERLPELVNAAVTGEPGMRAFARWVLANGGSAEDEMYLAGLLDSAEPKDYFLAAYAFRFFPAIRPGTLEKLRECAARLPENAERRAYVMSALFVHVPENELGDVRRALAGYIDSDKPDRYEIGEAIARRGDRRDIPVLEKLLADEDQDVRVSAANAMLMITAREREQ